MYLVVLRRGGCGGGRDGVEVGVANHLLLIVILVHGFLKALPFLCRVTFLLSSLWCFVFGFGLFGARQLVEILEHPLKGKIN